jgi:hypothetical protein
MKLGNLTRLEIERQELRQLLCFKWAGCDDDALKETKRKFPVPVIDVF